MLRFYSEIIKIKTKVSFAWEKSLELDFISEYFSVKLYWFQLELLYISLAGSYFFRVYQRVDRLKKIKNCRAHQRNSPTISSFNHLKSLRISALQDGFFIYFWDAYDFRLQPFHINNMVNIIYAAYNMRIP